MAMWVLFVLLHIPLALVMRDIPLIATAAAVLAGFTGVVFALDTTRPERVTLAAAYIAGADVLWRMTQANVTWQYGKYLTAGILLLALFLRRPAPRMNAAVLYFLLLLPSTLLTVFSLPLKEAWAQIDFNMSGPLALAACLWFFEGIAPIDRKQALRICLAILAPILGIMALAAAGVVTNDAIVFSSADSNFETSAGFLPNETSTSLGLAALVCFVAILLLRPPVPLGILLGVALFTALIQTVLTFSRSGLIFFVAGVAGATLIALWHKRNRRGAAVMLLALALLGLAATPGLAQFTGNTILERFTDLDSSGRLVATRAELAVWLTHPVIGVGPGLSDEARGQAAQTPSGKLVSHNEFTRLLSDHGLYGLAGGLILVALVWRGIRRAAANEALVWSVALAAWALTSFLVVDFRTVAAAFLLGVSTAHMNFEVQPRAAQPPVEAGDGSQARNAVAAPFAATHNKTP